MKIKKEEIREFVSILGFKPQDGDKDVYYKCYPEHDNYILKINFDKEIIEYGTKIQKGDATTSNFENSENFVVFECMNRVLEKGYPPQRISLEHKWPMGRREKGKLDILICDKDGKVYLMIECKTWGEEYDKEKKKMQRDGGQLFSYFQQDKSASYLCLYTSRFEKGKIEFSNDIVEVSEQWRDLDNQKEIFDHWSKNFKDNGIFDGWAKAYGVEIKALTRRRLREITEEDSGRIFNQFAEILRHNVVSDKPNAFNRIFNLFLCKIVDENRKADEELKFQWFENDTDETLQKRLSDLYKQGMKEYLTKDVTDYNDEEVAEKLYALDLETRETIKDMFTRVRLHKNNEFAFKEVHDEKSFRENAIVVREVVELLQPYQIRYGHKQQFLGDFFELLLNTGLKQEAGQFFTPVPIARFIISSLPIKELIEKKIERNEINFLPYMIDYAAGSGHFLTEAMDEVQTIIENFDTENYRPSVGSKIKSWKDSPFDWALEHIYGIEADYRLVKAAKVSCFLNGDGLANMIHADGLGHFRKNTDYKGKLKEISQEDKRDNAQFDILVANPPYSVSAFKNTLKFGDESFSLYRRLTDDSSEIECLFIERTKQLLKIGGWAGIILPSSILSNSGIYEDAREIILKYFDIKAIAEFGSNTFMATGTNTVALFLQRKSNNEWKKINQAIHSFFNNPKDATVNGIEKAFGKYVDEVFAGLELADYITLINKNPNELIQKQELFSDYKIWFNELTEIKQLKEKKAFRDKTESERQSELDELFYEKVFLSEQDKMLYFFLVYSQQIVLTQVGEKQAEKDFIGYEFSNRRGHEGIKMYRDEIGRRTTKLYDETDRLNSEKANSYIYQAFLQKEINIHPDLTENVSVFDMRELMDFKRPTFEKSISLGAKKKVEFKSKYELVRLGDKITLVSGQSPESNYYNNKGEGLPFYQGKTEFGEIFLNEPVVWTREITKEAFKNDIVMSVRAPVGPVNINPFERICIGRGLSAIRVGEDILNYYLFYLLMYNQKIISGNDGVIFQSISRHQIEAIKIPVPCKSIQEKIIEEIIAIEEREKALKEKIESNLDAISNRLHQFYYEYKNRIKLKDYFDINKETIDPRIAYNNRFFTYVDIDSIGKGTGKISFDRKVIGKNAASRARRIVENDSVIVSTVRPYLKGFAYISNVPADTIFSTGFAIIKSKDTRVYLSKLLYYFFMFSTDLMEQMESKMPKAAYPSVNKADIDTFEIPQIDITAQTKVIIEFEEIEHEITRIENLLTNMDDEKEQILKKYLE